MLVLSREGGRGGVGLEQGGRGGGIGLEHGGGGGGVLVFAGAFTTCVFLFH